MSINDEPREGGLERRGPGVAMEGSECAVAKSGAARAGRAATMHVSQLSAYRLSPQECRDVS